MSAKARLALVAGRPSPLGATWDGQGVNFALFSAHAEGVELCVFDGQEMQVLPMLFRSDQVWHGYLAGAAPGLRYAYRVQGPAAPENGQRFAAERLLLDPYAREVVGDFSWPTADEPAHGLQCSVVDEHFEWAGDAPPATPWADTVLHEVHVKGISQQHPDVPEKLRGTYAGLASPAMIAHFQRLGSPPSACCRCTISSTSNDWLAKAGSITGATTRSPSSLPNRATPRASTDNR
jgi:isoamylase